MGDRRRAASVEQQLIGLLDLLSVQAEDAGDLPAAQALAERALRLDRYTDSRYVRLAELLTMQNRVAAAIAVLDDAAGGGSGDRRRVPGRDEAPPRRAASPGGNGSVRSAPAARRVRASVDPPSARPTAATIGVKRNRAMTARRACLDDMMLARASNARPTTVDGRHLTALRLPTCCIGGR